MRVTMWMPTEICAYHSLQLDLLNFIGSHCVVFIVFKVAAMAAGHGDSVMVMSVSVRVVAPNKCPRSGSSL